jgi:hypothetical protein
MTPVRLPCPFTDTWNFWFLFGLYWLYQILLQPWCWFELIAGPDAVTESCWYGCVTNSVTDPGHCSDRAGSV